MYKGGLIAENVLYLMVDYRQPLGIGQKTETAVRYVYFKCYFIIQNIPKKLQKLFHVIFSKFMILIIFISNFFVANKKYQN